MTHWLVSLNIRDLRSKSARVKRVHDYQHLRMYIRCLQETHLVARGDEYIPSKEFLLYSVYIDCAVDDTPMGE